MDSCLGCTDFGLATSYKHKSTDHKKDDKKEDRNK